MALVEKKVLESERNSVYVKSTEGDRLVGTVENNKNVFDKYPELIRTKYNELIDLLISMGLDSVAKDLSDRYTKDETRGLVEAETRALVEDINIDLATGAITITKKDGTSQTIDTALEKIPATFEFEMDENNDRYYLKVTNTDGTVSRTEITNLMNQYTFQPSSTIAFTVTGSGTTTHVKAEILANSITLSALAEEVTQFINQSATQVATDRTVVEAAKKEVIDASITVTDNLALSIVVKEEAIKYGIMSKSYAIGTTGSRTGEETDNSAYYSRQAAYYSRQAETYKNQAHEIAGKDIVFRSELESTYATYAFIDDNCNKAGDITIPTEGWQDDVANSGFYILTLESEAVTEDSILEINLDADSILIADDCGLKPVVTSFNGGFMIYADSVPNDVMTGSLLITGRVLPLTAPGGGGGTGTPGVGIESIEQTTLSVEDDGDNVLTITLTDGTVQKFYVQNGSKGSKGDKGDPGSDANVTTSTIINALGYTPAKQSDVTQLSEEIVDFQKQIDNLSQAEAPEFVDSVDEMTDTSKRYVNTQTGTIWVHRLSTVTKVVTVTDEIVGTTENPYAAGRLPSSGTTTSSPYDYIVSPWIDLGKAEYQGKTIKLHLEGLRYITETYEQYVQNQVFAPDGTVLEQRAYSCLENTYGNMHRLVDNAEILDTTSAVLTINIPKIYGTSGMTIGRVRFGAHGTEADSNIYITYEEEQTVTDEQWVDTGVSYSGTGIDEETLAIISELNNEGADPTTIKLLASPVLDFYNASAYPDDDYTVTHLSKITYPCRADIPVPFTVKWNHNEDAMRTTLVVDTKAIGTANSYRMRIYDVTGFDNYPIYNLLPNTRYYYKVTHVLADGSLVEAKSGNFMTSNESVRLLNIDGTQNVRDLGGWTGLNGKKVKYGKLIRGAALSDSSFNGLIVTGKGRLSLGELKIQAELNLGAIDTETSIASNCAYKKIGYNNYAGAITGETYRAQFKEVLEWIVSCLNGSLAQAGLYTVERNVYFHCQGGCDRTGTLSFQLLGLLGVSESDLAKEYELSSFSDIGFGRLRTTTKAVDTYDYVGMVEAIKTYDGSTITDKFYNFAIACGVSADTITAFRNLMLE